VAFWKEEPSLRSALELVESDEVFVVPVFLAEGYFTREVVPRELGLDDRVDGLPRRVHYCAPVGTHARMAEMILRRALETCGLSAAERARAALVVIGHGTERNATSGDTVLRLTHELHAVSGFGTVECGFLDEAPRIEDVVERLACDDIVLVPFFVSEGWHSRTTIPRDLELEGAHTRRHGRRIWYTPPVGTLPEIADVAVELAREAEAADRERGQQLPEDEFAGGSDTGPAAARARPVFFAWVEEPGESGRGFLQLRVRRTADGKFEIRHLGDTGQPLDRLVRYPGAHAALEIARTTEAGGHRPLRSTPDLRRGWVLAGLDRAELWNAVSSIYPGAVVDWYRQQTGELHPTPFTATAARQSGIYARVAELRGQPLDAAMRACCGGGMCLRTRTWGAEAASESAGGATGQGGRTGVACREACTLFVSFAREALRAEAEPAALVRLVPSNSARVHLVAALRVTAELLAQGDVAVAETADFSDPMNPRRLRYLAGQLEREPHGTAGLDAVRGYGRSNSALACALEVFWTGSASDAGANGATRTRRSRFEPPLATAEAVLLAVAISSLAEAVRAAARRGATLGSLAVEIEVRRGEPGAPAPRLHMTLAIDTAPARPEVDAAVASTLARLRLLVREVAHDAAISHAVVARPAAAAASGG
jgi:sirohydrochlorin cobaltochelatase